MPKIELLTIIFVILVIEVVAGTVWFLKRTTPNGRSSRRAILSIIIANMVLVAVMLSQIFR